MSGLLFLGFKVLLDEVFCKREDLFSGSWYSITSLGLVLPGPHVRAYAVGRHTAWVLELGSRGREREREGGRERKRWKSFGAKTTVSALWTSLPARMVHSWMWSELPLSISRLQYVCTMYMGNDYFRVHTHSLSSSVWLTELTRDNHSCVI